MDRFARTLTLDSGIPQLQQPGLSLPLENHPDFVGYSLG